MSLSTKVRIGLAAGIVTGVFLDELAAPLSVVGRAFLASGPCARPVSTSGPPARSFSEERLHAFVDAFVGLEIRDGTVGS